MGSTASAHAARAAKGVRTGLFLLPLAATLAFAAPAHAQAALPAAQIQAAIGDAGISNDEVRAFYAARQFRPVWMRSGTFGPEVDRLVETFSSAKLDGLRPGRYRPGAIEDAIEKAREKRTPEAFAKADVLLSQSFVSYVRDLRKPRKTRMVIADPEALSKPPAASELLQAVAASQSLADYVEAAGWTHPVYAQLRAALAQVPRKSGQGRLLRLNLDRAAVLPADRKGRHVLVDIAGARLFLYENGRVRDTMKVIVGRDGHATPEIASQIRYAVVNPYWNVPPDLARERIVPHVLREGLSYLKAHGYEVLSDWSEHAAVTDPKLVNWQAVASGRTEVRLRQRPGGDNGMGRVKFMFPNNLGIYLHDTPEKQLFSEVDRRFSGGCIRLEDASRLGRWLYGKPLPTGGKSPEREVALPRPVPVFVTYMTAFPENGRIALRADSYGRDRKS